MLTTPVRTNPRSNGIKIRKTPAESLDDGSDKDPPKKNLENSHIVYTSSKRKRAT